MDCSKCMCPCCSKSAANNKKDDIRNVNIADCEEFRVAIQREIAHVIVTDYAQTELIEELQKRVKQLQDRVCDLLDFVTYNTYDRSHLVNPSVTEPLKQEPKMTRWFTPFEIYRRYLVGDYDEEGKPTRGFQTDEDIMNRVDPKPTQIITPINYLPRPEEDDRPEDRIKIKEMFIGIGSGSGAAESDLSEVYEMLNGPGRDEALKYLKKLWEQGVMGTDAMTVDVETGDAEE